MRSLNHTATSKNLGSIIFNANKIAQEQKQATQEQATPAPKFKVGDLVTVETTRQNTRTTGSTHTKSQKVMEVGSIEWREAIPYSDEVDGWGYRLRRPGSKTKGGQVLRAEAALTVAE